MKKILVLAMLLVTAAVWAHTPLLLVEDNGDGTIYIEAGFSNGSSAAGTDILIKLKSSGEVFWQGKMGEDYIETEMPSESYTVTLDAGPGHIVTKDGPEPAGGFGSASAAEEASETDPVPAESTVAASGENIAWSPSMTMGAVPQAPASAREIFMIVLGILQFAVIVYIALLLRKTKN